MTMQTQVFDGHNDVLLRLYKSKSSDAVSDFLEGEEAGHLDLKKARAGSFAGGLFALFSPSTANSIARGKQTTAEQGEVALPAPLTMDEARESIVGELAILLKIVRASRGDVAICRTTAEVKSTIERQALAVVVHIEGAEAIDGDLNFLEVLYAAGLRSLGPVWSRNNIFGHGVPFRFPSSPDTGEGLTDAGERLVRACNEMKILVDLSHINEKGFWDIARLSTRASGCDTLKRPCVMSFGQKSDRPATCRDPGIEGNGRLEFRNELPSPGRQDELRHASRLDGPST